MRRASRANNLDGTRESWGVLDYALASEQLQLGSLFLRLLGVAAHAGDDEAAGNRVHGKA